MRRAPAIVLALLVTALACAESTGVIAPTPAPPPPPPPPPVPLGPPVTVESFTPEFQRGVTGEEVWAPPQVTVFDANNHELDGIAVTCTVMSGDGSVPEHTTRTDLYGRGTCGPWTLGSAPGENTISVAVAGLSPVTFLAVAHEPTYFENYDLQSIGGVALPKVYPSSILSSGKIRFAQDSTFDTLELFLDQRWGPVPYVTHGRFKRSAEVVMFFDAGYPGPFAEGRFAGDLLTVYYFDDYGVGPAVYKKIP